MLAWIDKTLKSLLPKKQAGLDSRRALVKSVPRTLDHRYLLAADGPIPDEAFMRLRQDIFIAINRAGEQTVQGRTIFKESGKLPGGRPYFYIKPAGDRGWLVERSGSGWVVSRADKIVERGLFLRDYDAVDQTNIFYAPDGHTYPRVKSRRAGNELLSYAVYQQRLKQQLGLISEPRKM